MAGAMENKAGMKPMEFSVLYLIQRQLPTYWQNFFEANCNLHKTDCY